MRCVDMMWGQCAALKHVWGQCAVRRGWGQCAVWRHAVWAVCGVDTWCGGSVQCGDLRDKSYPWPDRMRVDLTRRIVYCVLCIAYCVTACVLT